MLYALKNFAHSKHSVKRGQPWKGGSDELMLKKGLVKKFDSEVEAEAFFAAKDEKDAKVAKEGANSKAQSRLLSEERKEARAVAEEPKEESKPKPKKGKSESKAKK